VGFRKRVHIFLEYEIEKGFSEMLDMQNIMA
jgi:hypothetical protein